MNLYYNYIEEGFYQILPILPIKKSGKLIILVGFGRKNLAFVFSKNKKEGRGLINVLFKKKPYQTQVANSGTTTVSSKVSGITPLPKLPTIPSGSFGKKVTLKKEHLAVIAGVLAIGVVGYFVFKKLKK